jgi:enoyl-CoA hydratase
MAYRHLSLERRDTVAVLRLASGKLNAISEALLAECHTALDDVESGHASALVLTGEPSRFFSYGLDVAGLLALDRPAMTSFFAAFNRLIDRLFLFPKPVAVAVNGHAMAGGLLLVACADLRIGGEGEYRLGLTEVKLGLAVPAGAARVVAHRFGPHLARDLCLTGRDVDPVRACDEGILDTLVPAETLVATTVERAASWGKLSGPGFAAAKRFLGDAVIAVDPERRREEDAAWLDCWFSPPARETLRALVERR